MKTFNIRYTKQNEMTNKVFNVLALAVLYAAILGFIWLQLRSIL